VDWKLPNSSRHASQVSSCRETLAWAEESRRPSRYSESNSGFRCLCRLKIYILLTIMRVLGRQKFPGPSQVISKVSPRPTDSRLYRAQRTVHHLGGFFVAKALHIDRRYC
jgi:hypothetical protein